MATVEHAIKENDVVEFTRPIGRWTEGRRGTVVSDYGDVKLIEVSDDRGQMLDLISVPERQLRLIAKYSD